MKKKRMRRIGITSDSYLMHNYEEKESGFMKTDIEKELQLLNGIVVR